MLIKLDHFHKLRIKITTYLKAPPAGNIPQISGIFTDLKSYHTFASSLIPPIESRLENYWILDIQNIEPSNWIFKIWIPTILNITHTGGFQKWWVSPTNPWVFLLK